MLTLKSNFPVIVDPKKPAELKEVYLKVKNVNYFGDRFEVLVSFYYLEPILAGGFSPKYLQPSVSRFTRQEAQGIEQMSGGLQGATFLDKYDNLIMYGCLYQLGVSPQFGLTPQDWSVFNG